MPPMRAPRSRRSARSSSTRPKAAASGYSIVNQWPGGFQAAITIQNTGSTPWSGWTLTWTFPNGQTISGLWNGAASQSGSNVTVQNLSYDGSIPAGGSYNGVGFTGIWNGTN